MSYCNKCGEKINDNQDFCISCGSRVVKGKNKDGKNKKLQTDKMLIVGIVTVAVIGAIFSTVNMLKKPPKLENVAIQNNDDSSSENNDLNNNITDNSENDDLNNNIKDNDESNDYYEEDKISDDNSEGIANYYIDKYKNIDYIIPKSDSVEVNFKALNDYTSEELFIARSELFARYGFIFKNQPNLQAYFESKSWYKANPSCYGELLKEVENKNLNIIKSIEFLKYARENNESINAGFVLPNSNTVELVASDVSGLNDWELVVARNEIFARYGLEFSTKELLEHFKSKSWFIINPDLGNDMSLTLLENKNVATILDEEKSRIESRLTHDLGE